MTENKKAKNSVDEYAESPPVKEDIKSEGEVTKKMIEEVETAESKMSDKERKEAIEKKEIEDKKEAARKRRGEKTSEEIVAAWVPKQN